MCVVFLCVYDTRVIFQQALLSRLERDDSVERIPLPPQYLPMLPGTNTPDVAVLTAAMLNVTRCNRAEHQRYYSPLSVTFLFRL